MGGIGLMNTRIIRWLLPSLSVFVAGCLFPVQDKVDRKVCELATLPRDLAPDSYETPSAMAGKEKKASAKPDPFVKPAISLAADMGISQALEHAVLKEQAPPVADPSSPFQIPEGFPGGNVPPIRLPALRPENEKERAAILARLYPKLPDLGPDPKPLSGPEGKPLALADLQRFALANSPTVRQAAANVEAAGAAIQAGAYPNPTFAYESDNVGTVGSPGFQGFWLEQVIKTANKLQLSPGGRGNGPGQRRTGGSAVPRRT